MLRRLSLFSLFYFFFSYCFAEQGVTHNKIKLGMSNALSGPSAELGLALRKGSLAYIKRINENHGIHGRKIELLSFDDGYEPINTVANTRTLLENNVFALVGYVGTPTSYAIVPQINKHNIPYLMPFSGAEFLRAPTNPNIFNLRASYLEEAEVQINFLVEQKGFTKIAIVMQADEFGLSVNNSLNKLLAKYQITPVVAARFKRNSQDIINVLTLLKEKPIESVIFIGTSTPLNRLIKLGDEQNFSPFYSSFSFVIGDNIFEKSPLSSRVVVTEVMPDPSQCDWNICQQFIKDMQLAGYTSFNRIMLEGYLNMHVFSEAAKQCGRNLTRLCLRLSFESFSMRDNGLSIDFSKENHQGMHNVYLSLSAGARRSSLQPKK